MALALKLNSVLILHSYHWGFIVGPKEEKNPPVPGVRYHVRNLPAPGYKYGQWVYEAVPLTNVQQSMRLLARILIGKIEDEQRLIRIIESVPVVQHDTNWRCRTWVADVLRALVNDGKAMGTAELDWKKVEGGAREYVGKKTAAGRYRSNIAAPPPRNPRHGESSNPPPRAPAQPMPTWDLLTQREIFP